MLLFLLDPMVSATVSKDSYHLPGGSGLSLYWQPCSSSFFSLSALSTGVANGPPAFFCLGYPRDDVSFANCPAFLCAILLGGQLLLLTSLAL